MAPGTPFGASIQRLATSLRYTHAISDERLAGRFGQVFQLSSSAGALANLFQAVKAHLDHRVVEIRTRLRRSRLICSAETSARVHGRNQWEWVFQNDEVCIHVIRPSRGHGVIQEVLGGHRPRVWVSDLSRAQKKHPAAQWQVCLAHQLRDCPFALEAGDTVFAPRMQALLLRAFAMHKRRDRLAESTLSQYRGDRRRRLARCLALEPETTQGQRLKKRYTAIQNHLFLFLEDASLTYQQLQRAGHAHAYSLSEGHQWLSVRLGTRPVCGCALDGQYRQTPGPVCISSHPEGPFVCPLFVRTRLSNYLLSYSCHTRDRLHR
jgi:transposase